MSNFQPAHCAAWLAVLTGSALACSLMPDTRNIVQKKVESKVMFQGTVVKNELTQGCGNEVRHLYFRVEKAYGFAASPGDTVVVSTFPNSSGCGVDYPVGREAVVFGIPALCETPAGMLQSGLGYSNVERPTQSQLDSLHGTSSLQSGPARDARAVRGPARSGSRVTYPVPGDDAMRRDAEGRAR